MKAVCLLLIQLLCFSGYGQTSEKTSSEPEKTINTTGCYDGREVPKIIKAGDKAFAEKDYLKAKEYFSRASVINPNDPYPKQKLAEIEALLAGSDAKTQFSKLKCDSITQLADQLFIDKKYNEAKAKYMEALVYKADNPHAKQRILEIDEILAVEDAGKKMDAYNDAIFRADVFFNQKSYLQAKSLYKEALAIDSTAAYPKYKIQEIDKHLAQINAEKEINARYDQLIYRADMLFAAKKYGEAKSKYEEATTVKPTETYPKQKLEEIHKILETTDANTKTEAYDKLIAEADALFKLKEYAIAKERYEKALAINAGAAYPRERIAEIIAIQNQDE
jgi:tetratricopeptide (TPR) repeat protein